MSTSFFMDYLNQMYLDGAQAKDKKAILLLSISGDASEFKPQLRIEYCRF